MKEIKKEPAARGEVLLSKFIVAFSNVYFEACIIINDYPNYKKALYKSLEAVIFVNNV